MELMNLKRLNRVLSVLLALSLCVSLFSIAALAGEEYDRPAAEAGLEELVTPTPTGGEEEGAPRPDTVQNGLPAPTAAEEEKEDVSSALFAATLVEKLKSHVLTEANHNGTVDRPGTPGIYSREYDTLCSGWRLSSTAVPPPMRIRLDRRLSASSTTRWSATTR